MLKKRVLFGLGAWFAMNIAVADSIYEQDLPLVWSSIITLSGGPSWGTAGQNQYLYPFPPPAYNYYTYNSVTSTMANAEIFFGLQRIVQPGIVGELGIGVAGVSDYKVTGSVNVNGIPNVYSYEYKVNNVRVELKGRLIAHNIDWVQPYISASLGAGWNNAHDFLPRSINEAQFPSPWFAENTTIGFPYSVGVGVQKALNPNWQVAIGYEFADLGKSILGTDYNTGIIGPRLTHMYTNELLFSISYLII